MGQELIYRQDALKAIQPGFSNDMTRDEIKKTAIRRINEIPSIDAKPVVQGDWILSGEIKCECPVYICSKCSETYVSLNVENTYYCPKCGANMRHKDKNKIKPPVYYSLWKDEINGTSDDYYEMVLSFLKDRYIDVTHQDITNHMICFNYQITDIIYEMKIIIDEESCTISTAYPFTCNEAFGVHINECIAEINPTLKYGAFMYNKQDKKIEYRMTYYTYKQLFSSYLLEKYYENAMFLMDLHYDVFLNASKGTLRDTEKKQYIFKFGDMVSRF